MSHEEWGPWIEYDGKGRPNLDFLPRQVEFADGLVSSSCGPSAITTRHSTYSGPLYHDSWDWSKPGNFVPVIRYRIRKPRALQQLRDIAASVKGPQHETA